MQLGGVSEGQIQRYEKDYSSFENSVRAYYANLHERVRRVGAAPAIGYFVKNDSGILAEGLRIEFDLEGDGHLLADQDDSPSSRNAFEMPKPPEQPNPALNYGHYALRNMPTLQDAMKPRDPVSFYWFDRQEGFARHSALQCQEFRATRVFRDSIFVSLFDDLPTTLSLRLHISAANLPEPINISAKVTIAEQAVEWSNEVVQTILPERISKLL